MPEKHIWIHRDNQQTMKTVALENALIAANALTSIMRNLNLYGIILFPLFEVLNANQAFCPPNQNRLFQLLANERMPTSVAAYAGVVTTEISKRRAF